MESLRDLENFYWSQEEPNRSCFLALKEVILQSEPGITPEWKYKLPFFYLNGKMFCYLWKDKLNGHPYIGFMDGNTFEHSKLIQEDRKRVKVLPIDPNSDLEIALINEVLEMAIEVHYEKYNS